MRPRLVAVLGYSDGTTEELHPICLARLARAEAEARRDDVVLLSGWARRRRPASEARLMERAWRGAATHVLVDGTARSTYGNAVGAAAAARAHGLSEVVVVTSGWHGGRAAALVRAALNGAGRVRLAPSVDGPSRHARIRELACWAFVPVQAALARRKR